MNKKGMIKDIYVSITSNILSTIISMIIVGIVPKIIGSFEYSYFQLYMFYSTYLGISNLGIVEGIYLRIGGQYFNNIDKRQIKSEFLFLCLLNLMISIIIIFTSYYCVSDKDKSIVLFAFGLEIILFAPKNFIYFIFQSTDKVRLYSYLTILDRMVYSILVFLMLSFWQCNFKTLILCDLLTRLSSALIAVSLAREILLSKVIRLMDLAAVLSKDLKSGINLLFANLSNMLSVGIIRFLIELHWGVLVFGKVSFAISMSNLLLILINAISVVLFPILRRVNKDNLKNLYIIMNDILSFMIILSFCLYVPGKIILDLWLPQYSESIRYMALIFPICLYETKMSLVISTFFKTLRLEKQLLRVNVITILVSAILTLISIYIIDSLMTTILLILVVSCFRYLFGDYEISKVINLYSYKEKIIEIVVVSFFVVINWNLSSVYAFLFYSLVCIAYLVIMRDRIGHCISCVKNFLKHKEE